MLQPELLTVSPEEGYKLLLSYENGEKKIFDVSPYISGAWYGELKDLETFKKVRVSNHSVEWEGTARVVLQFYICMNAYKTKREGT